MISIKNLSASVDQSVILHQISLDIEPGAVTLLMGPNGSGKSSLAHVLAGNPLYLTTAGTVTLDGKSLLPLLPHERSLLGLFVLFQNVPAIPGLTVFTLLKEALYARNQEFQDVAIFEKKIFEYMDFLGLDKSLLYRGVHDGFSGGEKKRFELLQLLILKPRWIIFDEVDSGLDVDAFRLVKKVIDLLMQENPQLGVLCITHYQKMAHSMQPSRVYILCNGRIVDSGGSELVERIECAGYSAYEQ